MGEFGGVGFVRIDWCYLVIEGVAGRLVSCGFVWRWVVWFVCWGLVLMVACAVSVYVALFGLILCCLLIRCLVLMFVGDYLCVGLLLFICFVCLGLVGLFGYCYSCLRYICVFLRIAPVGCA